MGKDRPKKSGLTSGKVAIFQLQVPMPPGMDDDEATEWLLADITLAAGLVAHHPQVSIGTAPMGEQSVPGGPRIVS